MTDKEKLVDESLQQAQDMIADFDSIIYKYADYPDAANHLDIIKIIKESRAIMQDLTQHVTNLTRALDPDYFDTDFMVCLNASELQGFGAIE